MNKRQRKKFLLKDVKKPPKLKYGQLCNLFPIMSIYIANFLRQFLDKGILTHPCFAPLTPEYKSDSEDLKKWRLIVEKMFWAFNQIAEGYPDNPYEIWLNKKISGKEFLSLNAPAEILAEEEKYFTKIQEGINLFAKYFRDLWD